MRHQVAQLQPIEWVASALLGVCYLLSIGADVPFYFPSGHSALFATEHYVLPLILALIVSFALQCRKQKQCSATLVLTSLRSVLGYTAIIYLHFNLKLWAQLINSKRWDLFYEHIDNFLTPLLRAINLIHAPFELLVYHWHHAYHDIFVGMFILSLTAHAFFSHRDNTLSES